MASNGATTRVTLRDVAAAADVSVATCSYALNGRADRVRPLPAQTRAKVEEAARRLGYTGNLAARVLRRQRTELIAVAYEPPVGPWLDRLTTQAEDIAEEHGYSVIGIPLRGRDRAEHSLRVITRGYVDGAIFVPGTADGLDVERLSHSTRAIVTFSDRLEGRHVDVIRTHVRSSTARATSYLMDSGRQRIAFMGHGIGRPQLDDRYQGFLDAHAERGLTPDPILICAGAQSRETAMIAVRDLLSQPLRPDALITASDRSASAALAVAASVGMVVPDDLAVIGSGNTGEASVSSPPLTSVGMHQFDFTAVVNMLFARIDDPTLPTQVLDMPWVLNHRAST